MRATSASLSSVNIGRLVEEFAILIIFETFRKLQEFADICPKRS
jgi:hypothetical protein